MALSGTHPHGLAAIGPTLRMVLLVAVVVPLGCTPVRDASSSGEGDSAQQSPTAENVVGEWNPWRVSPNPTVVIGESGGVEYALARVGDALRFSQGYIVPTNLPVGIRVYDREGQFQRWLGRKGEGPGEFRTISGTWVAEGDTVIVYDSSLRRVTYFDPGGDLLRTVPFDAGGSFVVGEERPRYIVDRFSDGSFLSRQTLYPPLPGPSDPEIATSSARFLREVPGTRLRDTITQAVDWDLAFEEEPGHRFGVWGVVPFSHITSAVARDTVLIVADNRRFEIEAWSSTGELMERYSKEHEVVPVTDHLWAGELDRREQRFLARMESTGNRQKLDVQGELAAIRRQFRGEKRPSTLPAHGRRMLADADGNIWIEAWEDDELVPSSIWHVFLAESQRFVGTVQLPSRFRPTAIYSDAVVGIHTDDLDVQSVREYPIIK